MDLGFEQDRCEWTTLTQSQPPCRRRWSFSIAMASALHVLVVALLCWPAAPAFVRPNSIAYGEGGSSTPASVVLYVPNDLQLAASSQPPLLSLPASAKKKPQKTKIRKRNNVLEAEKQIGPAEAGSEQGSAFDGPSSGDEVKPALPVAFQDLKIPRSELPSGVQGDVIVEITIDALGAVVDEKLLQGLGHGVDERVIAVLHDWHFRPATRNGVAIPSKHDVHFHFPS
ncbi:MAG TPA: TonB family protein [Candidatus Angelobacter sp.]|jgi:protein TonB|nr:TonB family protein [Candidatus Angelobacter sp.]